MMSIITTKELNKIYDADTIPVHAVNNVNLEFKEGEFTAIIGPSGCGKTTLLNLIGGLDSPTSGEVIINGTNITSLNSKDIIDFRLRNIGFVFQAYNLVPVLTAKENVEFIMLLQGVDKKKRDDRAKELLESVGLDDRMDTRPA
ncbi:MAG: ATP-binding cassette domain-containing protein, partial [Melioribacteraceae bacterium]